jgi:hypothetical protein
MVTKSSDPRSSKISREFSARLARLEPRQMVRAIVMLRTENASTPMGKRRSPVERKAAIERIRQTAKTALPAIDLILERFAGRRLADQVNALGSIPVEVTSAGIHALAASEHVKAILEDQSISLPEDRRRAL